jgi:hypothetical protein
LQEAYSSLNNDNSNPSKSFLNSASSLNSEQIDQSTQKFNKISSPFLKASTGGSDSKSTATQNESKGLSISTPSRLSTKISSLQGGLNMSAFNPFSPRPAGYVSPEPESLSTRSAKSPSTEEATGADELVHVSIMHV